MKDKKREFQPLSMSEAMGLFIVFGCGIFISIGVLVSEIVFKKAYESKI